MMPRVVCGGPPGLASVNEELQRAPELPAAQVATRADCSVIEKFRDGDFVGEVYCSEMCCRSSWTSWHVPDILVSPLHLCSTLECR